MRKDSTFTGNKERLVSFPTSISKVYLKGVPGVWPTIPSDVVDLLYHRAKEYASCDFQVKNLQQRLLSLRKEILRIVKDYKEVLGIGSAKDNFDLLVIPRRKVIWNRDLLKESLGVAYSGVVAEKEIRLRISIPVGLKAEELIEAINEALTKLGISREELEQLMISKIDIDVDEKRLEELIRRSQRFKLRAGTKKERIVWAIKAEPFNFKKRI